MRGMKILISLICVFSLLAQEEKGYDFRKTRWGMSKQEVKNIEESELMEEARGILKYKGEIGDHRGIILYGFTEDKLESGGYYFLDISTDYADAMLEYSEVEKLLVKKYRVPPEKSHAWINADAEMKYGESKWSEALKNGEAFLICEWELAKKYI